MIGGTNAFLITPSFKLTLDISAIGWDIYQGDQDILPGISVGTVIYFRCDICSNILKTFVI